MEKRDCRLIEISLYYKSMIFQLIFVSLQSAVSHRNK
ncbi:hypothetical protein BACUNI_03180 [Bacteroides uniformis ATCC 8492]|uniref:Uncharacterized protein n=1 Tax=Bacteroides uniformis (strain ATCC 8492 / DSM 6597 / CCUG 4942 / CIP 103695 / JCM 5828 / KCTC 5204 / NCTC 13054 / VPI 0061) TaxID=411479 RepID=A0ABC9N8R7_BACUC|nr:hypothetical protein BACUNI_03180 [Bacteroides uniformis ATCC 8492]